MMGFWKWFGKEVGDTIKWLLSMHDMIGYFGWYVGSTLFIYFVIEPFIYVTHYWYIFGPIIIVPALLILAYFSYRDNIKSCKDGVCFD